MNDSKVKVFLTRYDLFQKGIIECDAVIVNDVARVNLDGKEINVSEQGSTTTFVTIAERVILDDKIEQVRGF